ncbi:hypothetical protein JZ751_018482 [Albula glossodonta]|uniref:Hematopoietic cell signal transducer n=1 Tax=Albula glossodonta TaxID=121402 RepID=A0A8T2NRG4_9TELE|nr:hypothetical protein JZ751_018482 [Albula glossodonta]
MSCSGYRAGRELGVNMLAGAGRLCLTEKGIFCNVESAYCFKIEPGTMAGIIVGDVALTLLIVVVVFRCASRRRRKKEEGG